MFRPRANTVVPLTLFLCVNREVACQQLRIGDYLDSTIDTDFCSRPMDPKDFALPLVPLDVHTRTDVRAEGITGKNVAKEFAAA